MSIATLAAPMSRPQPFLALLSAVPARRPKPGRPRTEESRAELLRNLRIIERWCNLGWPIQDIAQFEGITTKTVRRVLKHKQRYLAAAASA